MPQRITDLPADVVQHILARLTLAHHIGRAAPTCKVVSVAVRNVIKALHFSGEIVTLWPANGEPTILELLRWKPTVLRGGSTAAAASIEGAASVLGDVLSDVLAALFMARALRERGSASSATLYLGPAGKKKLGDRGTSGATP